VQEQKNSFARLSPHDFLQQMKYIGYPMPFAIDFLCWLCASSQGNKPLLHGSFKAWHSKARFRSVMRMENEGYQDL